MSAPSLVKDTVLTSASPWWEAAVIYEVYPRSFADGDGDGVRVLAGLRICIAHALLRPRGSRILRRRAAWWTGCGPPRMLQGATPTWALGDHDIARAATRWAAQACAALEALLGLQGPAYLYQGQEFGVPEVNVALEARAETWGARGRVPLSAVVMPETRQLLASNAHVTSVAISGACGSPARQDAAQPVADPTHPPADTRSPRPL